VCIVFYNFLLHWIKVQNKIMKKVKRRWFILLFLVVKVNFPEVNWSTIVFKTIPFRIRFSGEIQSLFVLLFKLISFAKIIIKNRLARIRCILECIQCFRERKKLPACICYVPSEVEYRCQSKTTLRVYPEPLKNSRKIKDLHCTIESRLLASGEEYCNTQGKWLRLKKVSK
jgi:hypothetical protein